VLSPRHRHPPPGFRRGKCRAGQCREQPGCVPLQRRAGPEAAEHLAEALRIREAILPADDLDLATSLNNVASERIARGDYQGALLERAKVIVDRKPDAAKLRATVTQMLESSRALGRSKAEQK
jgi:hypothetical protein